jgi:membrane protein DedA with SNARE-associated domain
MAGDAIANAPRAYTRPYAVTDLLLSYGLYLLFLLIAVESAGVPLPGETALITAAILSERGQFHSIWWVIVIAATAAIVGDNIGYWLGRKGGRALLRRIPIVRDHFEKVLPRAERFFQRHGPKTVFLGRFIAVLRVTSAWLAGMSHMSWWKFLLWNALGGIVWAILVAEIAFHSGRAAADAISRYGLFGVLGIAVVLGLVVTGVHFWRKRMLRDS